jgi:hypothetical protein
MPSPARYLPNHFHVGGRQRQVTVGAVLASSAQIFMVSAGMKKQNQRKERVEPDQVGQVVGEETLLPKSGGGAQENKQGYKDVTGRTGEVTAQIAFADRSDYLPVQLDL